MKLLFLLLSLPSILSAPSPIKVDPETNHFVDSYGRQRFFHGVNAVYKVSRDETDVGTTMREDVLLLKMFTLLSASSATSFSLTCSSSFVNL